MVKGLQERDTRFCHERLSRRDNAGFTLMEFIVAAVIAGILAVAVAPNMVDFLNDNRLATQANALAADLRFARSQVFSDKLHALPDGYWTSSWSLVSSRCDSNPARA